MDRFKENFLFQRLNLKKTEMSTELYDAFAHEWAVQITKRFGLSDPDPELKEMALEVFLSGARCGQMSLRDRLAIAALPAVIQFCERERWDWAAERAYEVADSMLKARKM